ncbi:hypothetical protein FA13DRAFT_161985 [Coprinellus micaceus]|uniref:Uncharacterized protein n=1 Tax=Coprinellus micaceus TaxID=71717 RepID=A0A4Y7THE0_COPMI|nr:hypothetical protein FA13DRAFT_161985 [Coprinellus micaceus]
MSSSLPPLFKTFLSVTASSLNRCGPSNPGLSISLPTDPLRASLRLSTVLQASSSPCALPGAQHHLSLVRKTHPQKGGCFKATADPVTHCRLFTSSPAYARLSAPPHLGLPVGHTSSRNPTLRLRKAGSDPPSWDRTSCCARQRIQVRTRSRSRSRTRRRSRNITQTDTKTLKNRLKRPLAPPTYHLGQAHDPEEDPKVIPISTAASTSRPPSFRCRSRSTSTPRGLRGGGGWLVLPNQHRHLRWCVL